jgi:toxin ParE1/3/4
VKPYRFLTPARRELLLEIDYYRERSASTAERFLEQVEAAIRLVREHPDAGATGLRGTRHLPLTAFPHSLIYRALHDEILIVAFAHHKRRPGYWSRRL